MTHNKQTPSPLALIIKDARDFFDKVDCIAKAPAYNEADCKDAYTRFYRVVNRYNDQKAELKPGERAALEKFFDKDKFPRDAISLRTIADHRTHRTGAEVPLFTRGSIPLVAETSAGSLFSNRCFRVPNPNPLIKEVKRVDHLDDILKELERGLKKAIEAATED